MECLDKVIGITQSDCECLLDNFTEEQVQQMKESSTGVYLDDVEGAVTPDQIIDLSKCSDFFKESKRAIEGAKKKYLADLTVAVAQNQKLTKKNFKGTIGKPSYAGNLLSSDKRYNFVLLKPISFTDGDLKIHSVRLATNTTGTATVYLLKIHEDGTQEEITQKQVSIVANTFVDTGITASKLKLSEDSEQISYALVWEHPTALAKDNKAGCGCKGGDAYSGYITVTGGAGDDITNLKATDKFTHGFSINAEINCDQTKYICREFNQDLSIKVATAWAIAYKANELLIESIMASGEVNRYTMLNREFLWGKRNHFKKEYETRISWLADTIRVDTSDCFVCARRNIRVTGITS